MKKKDFYYHGVRIIYDDGIYYPQVNANVQCTSIRQVEHWIDFTYLPEQLKRHRDVDIAPAILDQFKACFELS